MIFENVTKFFRKLSRKQETSSKSKDTAKERLHLVLMQDRANVSADFLDLMRQEIIDVIKKYIEVDENAIDVRLTNQEKEDGTNGAPALYANIPIVNIKETAKNIEKEKGKNDKELKNKQDDKVKEDKLKVEVNKKEKDSKEIKNIKEKIKDLANVELEDNKEESNKKENSTKGDKKEE